jgi:hypothetical protein
MKRKPIAAILLVVILFVSACNSTDAKKAAQAAQDISASVNLLIDTKRDLLAQKLITNAEAIQIDKVLLELNSADRLFTQGVEQWKDGKLSKAEVVKLFASLNAAVRKLNDQSILQITNEQARATLSSVTATIAVSLGVIQAILPQN